MPEESRAPSTVRFGPFELSTDTGELRKNGIRIKLFGQPIKVLTLLVATPGQVVTREQLQRSLWPGDTFGDFERGLNAAVNRLREKLGDSATEPKYIETVPGRGYRFIAPINSPGEEERSPVVEFARPFVVPKLDETLRDHSHLTEGLNGAMHATGTDRPAILPVGSERPRYDTVPPLPQSFVPRRAELEALRHAIMDDRDSRHVALVALRGMGGIGKTVLAQAL